MDMLLCPNKETGHVTIAIVKPVNVSQSGSANNTAGVCILLKKKEEKKGGPLACLTREMTEKKIQFYKLISEHM